MYNCTNTRLYWTITSVCVQIVPHRHSKSESSPLRKGQLGTFREKAGLKYDLLSKSTFLKGNLRAEAKSSIHPHILIWLPPSALKPICPNHDMFPWPQRMIQRYICNPNQTNESSSLDSTSLGFSVPLQKILKSWDSKACRNCHFLHEVKVFHTSEQRWPKK